MGNFIEPNPDATWGVLRVLVDRCYAETRSYGSVTATVYHQTISGGINEYKFNVDSLFNKSGDGETVVECI